MANFNYPTTEDVKQFIEVIQEGNFKVKKYLPHIDEDWYSILSECIKYVHDTSCYVPEMNLNALCARMLYKITKRHELGDGNKRTAVMGVFIFCLVNEVYISSPKKLKSLAKRIARTKSRTNEDLISKRVSKELISITKPLPPPTS